MFHFRLLWPAVVNIVMVVEPLLLYPVLDVMVPFVVFSVWMDAHPLSVGSGSTACTQPMGFYDWLCPLRYTFSLKWQGTSIFQSFCFRKHLQQCQCDGQLTETDLPPQFACIEGNLNKMYCISSVYIVWLKCTRWNSQPTTSIYLIKIQTAWTQNLSWWLLYKYWCSVGRPVREDYLFLYTVARPGKKQWQLWWNWLGYPQNKHHCNCAHKYYIQPADIQEMIGLICVFCSVQNSK